MAPRLERDLTPAHPGERRIEARGRVIAQVLDVLARRRLITEARTQMKYAGAAEVRERIAHVVVVAVRARSVRVVATERRGVAAERGREALGRDAGVEHQRVAQHEV